MGAITLLHGSEQIVEVPALAFGNDHNDYGRGFYCTKVEEMAKEWACKSGKDGFGMQFLYDYYQTIPNYNIKLNLPLTDDIEYYKNAHWLLTYDLLCGKRYCLGK